MRSMCCLDCSCNNCCQQQNSNPNPRIPNSSCASTIPSFCALRCCCPCSCLACLVCSCSNCCQLQNYNPKSQTPNPSCASSKYCSSRSFASSNSLADQQLSLVFPFAASASALALSRSSISLRSPLQQQWPLPVYPAAVICILALNGSNSLADQQPVPFRSAPHLLACPWLISKKLLPAQFSPSRVASLRFSPLSPALFCSVPQLAALSFLVVVLSVMDVGCAFSAVSRCLLSCILFFFFFFVLQCVFRVKDPFLLRRSMVILGFQASGTVF